VDLDTCIRLINGTRSNTKGGVIAEYQGSDIQVIDGSYGPYIKHAGQNYKIPKGTDAQTLTEEQCKEIIANSEPTGRKRRRK
jgi:DNA topoisomerase-1